jgi:hypothetical protein
MSVEVAGGKLGRGQVVGVGLAPPVRLTDEHEPAGLREAAQGPERPAVAAPDPAGPEETARSTLAGSRVRGRVALDDRQVRGGRPSCRALAATGTS